MLTKDSPEVQDLLARIQQVVPGLTGPIGKLWDYHYNGYVGVEIVYDQEPPTSMLQEFRPGHYGLMVVYLVHEDHNDETSPPAWEVGDYGCGLWFIPVTDSDGALLKVIGDPLKALQD